ncbi:hypothetical protein ACFOGJ_07460 [Marinibaculum pumilum]|uniref:Integral membrane protein n=1 Tax=Marinibaculum pumilum TaxID=1766165 RepID=A0ABV7KXL8_9PROT
MTSHDRPTSAAASERARTNLRRVLFVDAASSAAAGLVLAVLPQSLAPLIFPDGGTMLGLDTAGWLLVTGLAFLVFAASVAAAAAPVRPHRGAVATIVGANLAFVAGCGLLLLFGGGGISWAGWILVLLTIDMVAVYAWLEFRYQRASQARMGTVAAGQPVDAIRV